MDRLERCRKLCEQIEVNYLHRDTFKLSAAQKYIEVCNEWVGLMEALDMKVVKYAFGLLIQPLPAHLSTLLARKKVGDLEAFFASALALFGHCANRCEASDQESLLSCHQMCIDVHKLRLVAFPKNQEYYNEALEFVTSVSSSFPTNGILWFQKCIVEYTLQPRKMTKCVELESLLRCITAKNNRPNTAQLLVLVKKLDLDFNSNLLGFMLKDLESVIVNKTKHWSFLRYFDRFICSSHVVFPTEELICVCLFVFGLALLEANDTGVQSFLSLVFSATNSTISQNWPLVLLLSLYFIQNLSVTIGESLWIKVLQLLRSESYSGFKPDSLQVLKCFTGTVIECASELISIDQYDFEEDLSIERDGILAELEGFFSGDSGMFAEYVCKTDGEYQLGPKFHKEPAPAAEEAKAAQDEATLFSFVPKDDSQLNQGISDLQERLKMLETKEATSPKSDEIVLGDNRFVVDTNVLICNDQLVRDEFGTHPERFFLPLVVLVEIEKIRESPERECFANRALDFLEPLLQADRLFVVNNYGRILRSHELKQQLELLAFTADNRVNDERIIDICRELSRNCRIVLLTDDVNMRLKAQTRQIKSISVKEFRKLFNR